MIRLSNVLFFNSANNKRLLAVYSSLISLILIYPIVNTYIDNTINIYICMYVCMYVCMGYSIYARTNSFDLGFQTIIIT